MNDKFIVLEPETLKDGTKAELYRVIHSDNSLHSDHAIIAYVKHKINAEWVAMALTIQLEKDLKTISAGYADGLDV